MAAIEDDWYWMEGSAYCPHCVACGVTAIDAAGATRGPAQACGRCDWLQRAGQCPHESGYTYRRELHGNHGA